MSERFVISEERTVIDWDNLIPLLREYHEDHLADALGTFRTRVVKAPDSKLSVKDENTLMDVVRRLREEEVDTGQDILTVWLDDVAVLYGTIEVHNTVS